MDPAKRAIEEFSKLGSSEQARIRREGMGMGARVASHVVQDLFGPWGNAADPGSINHSSAVTIHTGGKIVLATAEHVLCAYENRLKTEENVGFQAGNLLLDPTRRVVWRDSTRDLALLEIRANELVLIPALTWQATGWPPSIPAAGSYIAFAGHPTAFRENLGPGSVRLNVVGGMMAVTSRSADNIKCAMLRENLIPMLGSAVPPRGTNMGGMSGGPVFHVLDGKFELVGIITDFGSDFDMFWMATFADVVM